MATYASPSHLRLALPVVELALPREQRALVVAARPEPTLPLSG